MSDAGRADIDENPRLNAAIERFLFEEATGSGCDRSRLLGEYDDIREDLKEFFGAHDRMNELAAGLRLSASVLGRSDATALESDAFGKPEGASGTLPASDADVLAAVVAAGRVHYFGDYELLEEIARGGMGVVYRARQVTLNRIVAVKMILSGQFASKEDIQRFRAEAEAAAHLDHPGIVPVYEVGEFEGQHYFSMGFVDGASLTSELADGPLAPRRAAALVRNVAEAVGYAHGEGVIHRDLKPGNILLDGSGRPRVTDFGLAKRLRAEESLTATGQILGTPSYMPPEQATGRADRVRETADVYSLGAVLYACLTGRPPFQADNPMDTMRQVLDQEPVPPRQLNPLIPRDLETICLKCLEKSRRRRYATMQNLSTDLERFLNGEPVEARPISSVARLGRWCRRRPVVASLLVLLVLSMTTGTAVSSYFGWRASERAEAAEVAEGLATERATAEASARAAEREERLRAERLAARIAMNRGLDMCRRGETHEGLLWLARALEGVPEDSAELERAVRTHLGTWRERCKPVTAVHSLRGEFVAISPDGRFVLTRASADEGSEQLVVHETESGRTVWDGTIDGVFREAFFSDDGDWLAVSVEEGILLVQSLETPESEIRTLRHDNPVDQAAFVGDGPTLMSIDEKSTLRNWDPATGTPISRPERLPGSVTAVAAHQSTGLLAVGYEGVGVDLFAAGDVTPLGERLEITGPVRRLRFSDDGVRLAADGADGVQVWDVSAREELLNLNNQGNCAWSNSLTVVTVGRSDGRARVWNVEPAALASEPFERGFDTGGSIRDADAGYLVCSSRIHGWTTQSGHVQAWSTATGEPLTPPLYHSRIDGIALSDGRMLTVGEGVLRTWSLESRTHRIEPIVRIPHPEVGWVATVEFSPDGSTLLTGTVDGWGRLWNAETGDLIHGTIFHRQHGGEVRRAIFSPDGEIIATASHDETVRLWNADDGSPIGEPLPHSHPNEPRMVWSVAFHPDGQRLASGTGSYGSPPSREVRIRLWDVETGAELARSVSQFGGIRCLDFSPDGELLASAGLDGNARLWNASTLEAVGLPMPHPADVRAVAFHPGGEAIITGCEDGLARVWSIETGEPIGVSMKHDQAISSVDVSPDGARIATAGHDGTARLWDARTGQSIGEPLRHKAPVWWVAFHPDGMRLATGSTDRLAQIWQLQPVADEPADQIMLWAEVSTGMALNTDGATYVLSPEEWQDRRDRLMPATDRRR